MKNLFIKTIFAGLFLCIATAIQAQPYFDRDGIYNPERRAYLTAAYNLTSEQLAQYDAALAEKAAQSHVFFDTPHPRKEWIAGHIDLCKQFQNKVKTFFSPDQYAKWAADNRNSDQIRRYRENLNLSDMSLTQMLQIIEDGKKELHGIAQQKIPEKDKKALQRETLDKRNKALKALVGEMKGEELIRYIDLEDKAAFVRTYFPQFSYNLSYVVGQNYLDFTYATRAAEWSDKDAKTITAEKHTAHMKLLADMKASLTSEQYAQWHEYHFRYHDNYIRYTHDMTPQQYEIYKDVMNSRAIGRLAVVKTGATGDAKAMKLDSVDRITYDALSEKISTQCADMWIKNAYPNK